MSIRIDQTKCVGCGRCAEACPGNLLRINTRRKAEIRIPEDCWGCTSCMKECPAGAIRFFLEADIGGRGAEMSYRREGDIAQWTVHFRDGGRRVIEVDRKNANVY